jgi:exodeoxyribonuclease VIII
MTCHAMIDLETLGTTPDAVILCVGGVKFDPNTDRIYDEIHYRLDIDEQQNNNRSIDHGTIEWWGQQPASIIEAAFDPDGRTPVISFLEDFKRWCVGVDSFWAQGPTFDMIILENLYRQYNRPYPWPFWGIRDSRTLFGIMPSDPRRELKFEAHNALEDCRAQAKCVQYCVNKLGLTLK